MTPVWIADKEGRKLRQLPNSIENERSVLAGMMLDPEAIGKVLNILDAPDFFHAHHKQIFKTIVGMHNRGEAVDAVTVLGAFQGTEYLKGVGGVGYFVDMVETLPTAANISFYAKKVKELALRRAVISNAHELLAEAYEELEVEALIDSAQKRFTRLEMPGNKQYSTIHQLLEEGFREVDHLHNNEGEITGLPTGFIDLDGVLGGLQKTDLVIIAGRPSMGKSSLCCQIATNLALGKKRVGYFSIEVANRQVIKNIFACQGRIDTTKLRQGGFESTDWESLTSVFERMKPTTFSIDDMSRTTQDIIRQARRMYAEHGLDIIFVDHIQELREKGRHENRNQEVDMIAGNLKMLAKELNIPVVVVAQLSRKVEDRGGDFKPRLSDLRDSGSLEQKADLIMFVYREEYYLKEKAEKKGTAEVIIAKHRNGPLGAVELRWDKQSIRFDSIRG